MLTPIVPSTTNELAPVTMRSKFMKLIASKDRKRIQRAIEAKYGFVPSEKYCRDLAEFILEVTNEQPNHSPSAMVLRTYPHSASLPQLRP